MTRASGCSRTGRHGIPVWAKAISAQGTVKATAGSVNVDIVCAGAVVRAGDAVVGDMDGVVVMKSHRAGEIAQLSQRLIEKERRTRQRLVTGKLGLDIYGLRAKLTELGVEYVENQADFSASPTRLG